MIHDRVTSITKSRRKKKKTPIHGIIIRIQIKKTWNIPIEHSVRVAGSKQASNQGEERKHISKKCVSSLSNYLPLIIAPIIPRDNE